MIKYIWGCGARYATIEMAESEMARIEDDAFSLARLEEEVYAFLTHDHQHSFKTFVDKAKNQVIHICDQGKPKRENQV